MYEAIVIEAVSLNTHFHYNHCRQLNLQHTILPLTQGFQSQKRSYEARAS